MGDGCSLIWTRPTRPRCALDRSFTQWQPLASQVLIEDAPGIVGDCNHLQCALSEDVNLIAAKANHVIGHLAIAIGLQCVARVEALCGSMFLVVDPVFEGLRNR